MTTPDADLRLHPHAVTICPACGSSKRRIFGQTKDTLSSELLRLTGNNNPVKPWENRLFRCLDCELIFLDPRPNTHSLLMLYRSWYEVGYQKSLAAAHGDTIRVREFTSYHLSYIVRASPPGNRLLDVGTGTGVFAQVAQENGWLSEGIDWSLTAVEQAGKLGRNNVRRERIESIAKSGAVFDVITMFDYLEHTETPREDLAQALECLAPNGLIAIRVPNMESIQARLMGLRWVGIMSLHLIYFNKKSLVRLLKSQGLEIAGIHCQNYQSLPALLSRKISWLYARTKFIPRKPIDQQTISEQAVATTFGRLSAYIYGSICEGIDHIAGWFGHGNQIFIVGRKRR